VRDDFASHVFCAMNPSFLGFPLNTEGSLHLEQRICPFFPSLFSHAVSIDIALRLQPLRAAPEICTEPPLFRHLTNQAP
jgi:hypothetical protein